MVNDKKTDNGNDLKPTAKVVAVQDDLVEVQLIESNDNDYQLVKNEVIYLIPSQANDRGEKELIKAEILRVKGITADAQV